VAIALSPQGSGLIFPPDAWHEISKPVLMITGTRDTELGGASWKTRTEPFKNMRVGDKWLAVISGATHMNLAGNGISHQSETMTLETIQAFLRHLHQRDSPLPQSGHSIEIQTK
jgi:predicted dienelactone hydrolase